MVAWRVAKSLNKLLGQINTMAPNRNKESDGSIGDAAHASTASDHNPWVDDPQSSVNVVTARDFTHDPANGADMFKISEALRLSRDPRIKYVIFHDRVFSSVNQPWVWRPYSGSNNHRHHMHGSVVPDYPLYDDVQDWKIGMPDLTQAQINSLMDAVNQITWELRPWTGESLTTVKRVEASSIEMKLKIAALEAKLDQILTILAEDQNIDGFTDAHLVELKNKLAELEAETRQTLLDGINTANSTVIEQAARKAIEEYSRERAEDVLDND